MAIELLEADCEIGFGLVDVAAAECSAGHPEGAMRALDDAETVILDIHRRLLRLTEAQRAPFGPLVGELRREITEARHNVPPIH